MAMASFRSVRAAPLVLALATGYTFRVERPIDSASSAITFVISDPDVHTALQTTQVRLISERSDTTARPTDSLGNVTLDRLAPGAYAVLVRRIGYPGLAGNVDLPPACHRRVEVELRAHRCDLDPACQDPRGRMHVGPCPPGA